MNKLRGDDFDVSSESEVDKDYLNVDLNSDNGKAKITVRPFVLTDFEDVKPILTR
jgi:hypothetical protein